MASHVRCILKYILGTLLELSHLRDRFYERVVLLPLNQLLVHGLTRYDT